MKFLLSFSWFIFCFPFFYVWAEEINVRLPYPTVRDYSVVKSLEYSLPCPINPGELNNYQVYLLKDRSNISSGPHFNYFRRAKQKKIRKATFQVLSKGFRLTNRDPKNWLYIPFAEGFEHPHNRNQIVVFLQEFVTDTKSQIFSPLVATVFSRGEYDKLSRRRLIQEVFKTPPPEATSGPEFQKNHLAILVDLSGTMGKHLEEVKRQLHSIIKKYRGQDRFYISLVSFATDIVNVQKQTLARDFPMRVIDNLRVQDGVRRRRYKGSKGVIFERTYMGNTNIAKALEEANEILKEDRDENEDEISRNILLISDGVPYDKKKSGVGEFGKIKIVRRSQKETKEAADECKRAKIRLQSVYIGPKNPIEAYGELKINSELVDRYNLSSPEDFFQTISEKYSAITPEEIEERIDIPIAYSDSNNKIGESPYRFDIPIEKEDIEEIKEQKKDQKILFLDMILKERGNIAGIFLVENHRQIVMFDLFSSNQMFAISTSDIGRAYSYYSVDRSFSDNAPIPQEGRVKGKRIKVEVEAIFKSLQKNEGYRIEGKHPQYPYRFVRISSGPRLGFYFSLGEQIFHIHMVSSIGK